MPKPKTIPIKVEVHRNGDISIDRVHVPRSEIQESLEMYADPKFELSFVAWCWLVHPDQVRRVKGIFQAIIQKKGDKNAEHV